MHKAAVALLVEEKMATAKTRFPQVKLEELKKIIPEISDENENHKGNSKPEPRVSGTPKTKPKARRIPQQGEPE
jgi:hypothetical protein